MTNAPVDPRLVEFVRQRRKATGPVDPKLVDFVRQRRAAMKAQTPVEQPGLGTIAKAGLASGTVGAVTGAARLGQSAASFIGAMPRYIDTAKAAVVGRGVQAVEDPIGTAFGVASVNPDVAALIEANVTAPDRGAEIAARQIAKPMKMAGDIGSAVEGGITAKAGARAQIPYTKEWFTFNAGQMVPQIAASIGLTTAGTVVGGPGVGLAAGFGSTFAMEGGDQAKSIYDAEIAKGTDPESAAVKAFMPSVVTGLINAGIEQMGIEALIRTGQLANGIRKSLASWFAGGVSEGVQEGLQGNTQRMYADTAWNPTSAENLSQTGQESVLGATMGLGSAVPGGVGAALTREAKAPKARVNQPVVPPPQTKGEPRSQLIPPAPVVSPTAQAAAARLRQQSAPSVTTTPVNPQPGAVPVTVTPTPVEESGPLIPPGQQPSEQDLADARAIITRDPSIVTQPSRFRAEYLAARKRRAQPARPVAYTDNPDLATVLGADQIGLTNIRTPKPTSQPDVLGGDSLQTLVETAQTGQPISAKMYRTEWKGRKDYQRGVFYTSRDLAGRFSANATGDPVAAESVELANPLVFWSKTSFLKQLADAGDTKAKSLMRIVDPANIPSMSDLARDPSQSEKLAQLALAERYITRKAAEMGHDGWVSQFDMEVVKGPQTRENANAAQRYESGGSAPGAVAVRGPDVPAAPAPAVQDRAVPPADQGRGVAGAADVAAAPSPVGDGVGEVVRGQGAQAGDQPGDVGVEPSVAAFLRGRTDDELRTIKLADDAALDRLAQTEQYGGLVEVFRANPDAVRAEMRRRPAVGDQSPSQAPKQPWEMTRGEYAKTMAVQSYANSPVFSKNEIADYERVWARRHKDRVQEALSEGKPVPAEVLAEYPDLVPNSSVSPNSSPATPAPRTETPAIDYADDIPINVAVGAFTNTSHTPEKRGQARREEYAATLKSAREELDRAAVTPEQKAIADAEFARYRDGMKRRMLDYLRAHSRVASAMITGPANFPTERNRKAGNAADKRLNELMDFDKRARAAMMKAVRGAATPEMMASEESARLEKRVQRFIDHAEDPKGGATSLFKSNLQGALERAAKNGETTAVANALRKLRDWQTSAGRTIFTNRASIWKLADVSEKAVEEAAAAPTGEQEHATYADGTRVVRNYGDDRLRIFFPGKPSDSERTTLKSRGFKWSPANGAWQRQNTQAAVYAADDILRGFGKQKNQDATPAPAAKPPTPATVKADTLADKISDIREKIAAETNDRALDDLAERAALLADGADRANRIDLVNLAQKYKQQAAEKAAGIRTLRRVQAAEPAPTPKPPSTPDPATLPAGPTGVEKYGIYSVRVRDRGTMYAVRTSERADGFGDSMFESVAEAKDYANDQRERDTANAEFRSREAAENERKEAAKAQRDAERSDTDGFADSLDPMRRGKVIASLAALVNIDGVVQSARDHVRAMVKSGNVELSTREVDKIKPMSRAAFNRADNRQQEAHERRVKEGGKITEYRINGYNLGKTAYEYAQHLVNRQSESQHPDPATLPRPQLVRLAKERGVDTKGTKKEIAERVKAQTASSPEQQTTTPAPATDAETIIDRSTKIREHLNAAIARRKAPSIWIDHQLITEDGKYDVDENGKRTKVQDLSAAGFLKNADEIYDAVVNEGVQYAGMNEAAKDLVARVRAKRDVREQEAAKERAKEQEQSQKKAASESAVRALLDNATAAAKFKTENVEVKFGEETKTISMKVYNGLGIWKVPESGWYNVTHLKTSKRFDQYRTLGEAKVAVVRMSLLADFTQDEAGILKQFDEGEYRNEIVPLRDSVYAVSPRLVAMVDAGSTPTPKAATTPTTTVPQKAREALAYAESVLYHHGKVRKGTDGVAITFKSKRNDFVRGTEAARILGILGNGGWDVRYDDKGVWYVSIKPKPAADTTPDPATTSTPAVPKAAQEYAAKFGVVLTVEKHGIYGNEWDYVAQPENANWYPNSKPRRAPVGQDPRNIVRAVAEEIGTGESDPGRINTFRVTQKRKDQVAADTTPQEQPSEEEPAPADVAQGSEPSAAEDRYGIRDAAAAFVATTKAKYDQIVKELEEARKQRAEASARGDYSDEAWVKFQKLEAQQQNWSGKLKNAQQIGDDANAMADALANNSPTDPTSAGAIYDAYRRAARGSIDFTTSLPRAAMDAIDTAIRTLLVPSGVDAGTDTTLYVWRDEYDTGIEDATKADRIKAAKDLAAKMVKEDKAARAELQRIAERGVMITDAGKIVARPEAKPTVTREPKVTPYKTVADMVKGIAVAAAKETTRYAINGIQVANKGTRLVVTDGRRLWLHERKQGFGVGDGLMQHDGKGGLKAGVIEVAFPPYEDVIPRHGPEDNLGDHDPVKMANMLRRAQLMTSEESSGVLVTRNARGEMGFVASAEEVGEAHIGPRGTEALFAINPVFMAEALEWHAKNGAETVKIENAAPNKPIVITGFSLKDGDKTTSVTMPVSYTSDSDGSSRSREGLSTTAASRGVIDKPTIDAKLDAIADAAKERLATRAKKQAKNKTLNAGLNPEQVATALRDTVDLSIVGAAKAAAAGVRAGRALTKIVDAAIAEMGRTVTPKVRAIIQKNVRKILAESGGDPVKFEQVVKEMYEAPVTKREIKAAKDAAKGQGVAKAERTAAGRILAATRKGYKAGIRDERRTAIANMQGVVNDIKRERGRLRSLAQFEKRAGEVAVKMTADDARRAQMIRDGIRKQVVQYARTLPKEVRGKLVGRIATADTPTKMIQTVRELQRELMRHDGREAWGWIKKNARSSAVDKLKGVTNDLRKSVADLYAKAASAKRRIDAAETLKDSSIALAELQNLQAEIGLHITTARAAFKAIKGQRQQSAFQIATNAADIIAKRFAKRSGDGVSQIRDPKRWWIRKHLDSYNDLRNMLATLEGDNGPLFSAIWEALEEGSAEYSTLRRDKRAAMEQAYVRAGFKDMADAIDSLSAFAGRGVEKNYTVTVGGESKTLSLGEISSLIAHNSDPETAALIASEHGMRFKSTEGTGSDGVIPTPNEIKDMAAAIAKDYKLAQLVDDLKAIIEKDADSTLREVGELTGVQPKKVEKRWTRSREMEMVPGMEDKPITTADPSMVNVIRSFAENMGIYEHRTQTTGIPILLKDVHSVMEEEIHKQAATLALARRVRDAMLVLTQDQLGKAIINAKGVEFYRSLKRQVMAAGRTEVVYATQAEKAVGFLKGSAAVKYLAANPSTYIGNLLGTLRVLPDVDARYYAAGIAAMWSMSRAELEAKSGYLWDRWEQQGMGRFGPSHEATMDARLTQAHTGFRSFLREIGRQVRNSMKNAGRLDLGAGLTNLRLGSAAFMQGLNWVESRIAAFTWGAMDAKIRSEQPNLSDKARQKIVEKFVRREMRETQNGGDPVDAATIATQNRSSAASMVMFLLSDVMKVRNRVKRAFRQSKTYGSKVLAAEAVGALAKAYAVKYLWDSIAFGIAGALGDDDDKERITERMKEWTSPIERAAQELFQIVAPIGGPDLASLIDALRGRYSDRARGGPVAMLAPLNDARAAGWDAFSVIAKSIENDDMNAEKIGLALAKFFDETASAFGLNPLSPWTRRVLREIVQTRKSEWW